VNPPVLVLGAGDTFGIELVEALLADGRQVIAVRLSDETAASNLAAHEAKRVRRTRTPVLEGSVRTDEDAAVLAAALARLPVPPLQAVVNLPLTCERGRLLEQPAGFLERILHGDLFPQVHAARHLLPLLAASGRCARYLIVGMPYAGTPWAGYGHYSVVAAATRMLVQVLRQETADTAVRVQQLVIGAPVRTPENAHCACDAWPDAADVARHAASVLADSDDSAIFVDYQAPGTTVAETEFEVTE
jgi:NAD(P)-dependent dehydrogenase (short-subunit alcohol dehydrogenase family)